MSYSRILFPTPGNVIFTLLMIGLLLWAQTAGAVPLGLSTVATSATAGTIAYQGRLADADGTPVTATVNMIFRLYNQATGGTPLWEEQWTGSNAVQVSDGLFNVMLGSLTPIPQSVITGNGSLFLGITVGTDDEMSPRVQLGNVPWAVQALTVPDGSITTEKIADGAVTSAKLNVDNGLVVTRSWPQIELRDPATTNKGKIGIGTHRMTFHTGDPSVERMAILHSNGYVGIGTDSPGTLLNLQARRPVLTLGSTDADDKGISLEYNELDEELRVQARNRSGDSWKASLMVIERDTGRVGIGLTNPAGKLHVQGDFLVTGGAKSAVVETDAFGHRKLYAAESPEVRFFDEGLARLRDGVARVELDPIFVQTIEGEYLVHVTPYGDASLYVAEVGKDYFVVKAREGNASVEFAWRLSAHRKGYPGIRLEEVTAAK